MVPARGANRRRWIVASAVGAAAALSIGVFAATRDDGHGAVPSTTTTPATTTPGRTATSVTPPEQPNRRSGRSGSQGNQPSTGQTPSGGSSQTPSGGSSQTPSGGSSQSPDNGNSQFPDGSQLPGLGQLPSINGQSIDEIIREILRQLGIDPDTVLPPSGQQGATTNGSGVGQ
jgi:hypothetical protein